MLRELCARLATLPIGGWYSTPPPVLEEMRRLELAEPPIEHRAPTLRSIRAPEIRWTSLSAVR